MSFVALCTAGLVAACSDGSQPTGPAALSPGASVSARNGPKSDVNYVAIGTSISMGWASNGVYPDRRSCRCPRLLGFGPSHAISLPLIQSPGCTSANRRAPIGAGHAVERRVDRRTDRLRGERDWRRAARRKTSPWPAPSRSTSSRPRRKQSRPTFHGSAECCPPAQRRSTAALAQQPTIVSVELGGNEVLNSTSGLFAPGVTVVPFPYFARSI